MMLVFLSVLCVLYGFWTWRMRTRKSPLDPPYYPGVYPIIGHTYILSAGPKARSLEFVLDVSIGSPPITCGCSICNSAYPCGGMKMQSFNLISRIAKKCSEKGGVARIQLGLQMYYGITDPEDALTAANGCLTKHYAYSWGKCWLGEGLITASGLNWKRHRQMIVPAFSLPILHGFIQVFNSQGKILVKNLSAKAGTGHFDILPILSEHSFKIICITAFGIDPLDDGDFIKNYTQSVDTILGMMVTRFFNVLLHSGVIYELVGRKKKEDDVLKILNNMSDIIIKKKRATLNNKNSGVTDSSNSKGLKYKSLLDLLLELSENNALSDQEIREEVDTFVVAGYDTTALTVAYVLMDLGTYPEIQERVYQEIIAVAGGTDRDLEKIDYPQLVFTEAVIKETLRLHPIAPVLLRYADKDVQLKNYKIPAGSNVAVLVNGLNRERVWGVDADEFRPERWLNVDSQQSRAFGSFSLGKRSCVGQHFSLLSVKTTLFHIIREYRVIADIKALKFKVDFILKPDGGCKMVLERRN